LLDVSIMRSERELLERISQLGGLDLHGEARAALEATLIALGERLVEDEREIIASALPPQLGSILQRRKHRGMFDVAEFYDRVRRKEGTNLGFAREHAQIVCRVLGESLPDRLLEVLPAPFAELFRAPESGEPPPPRSTASTTAHTLAAGRPGSRHPIGESRPAAAHTHSVAERNPHAETKLSSTSGTTQERLGDSLSTAKADPRRRISRARG
jgi:uncharacterized protein (DUF2267 family)